MLNEHTLNQLRGLRLDGMVRAIEEQTTSTAASALGFDERLTMLVQREVAWRDFDALALNRAINALSSSALLCANAADFKGGI